LGSAKKILLIDDELLVKKTLVKILREEGYSIVTAKGSADAMRAIKNSRFDTVILDIKLRNDDGLKLLKKIKGIDRDVPVILLSGFLTIDVIEKACRMGIFNYIRKPFRIDDLKIKIRRAVKSRTAVAAAKNYSGEKQT